MNQCKFDIVMGAIADLKRERDVLREWQRNALAVTKRQAETIKALEARLAQWESIFIETDPEQERLREMAAKEGNGCISVGGLACRIKNDELQTATEPPECTKTEWQLSLFRAIKSLKLSIYSLEISGFQRLDAKKRSVGLTADEAAEHERLTKCAEWVFDDTLPG